MVHFRLESTHDYELQSHSNVMLLKDPKYQLDDNLSLEYDVDNRISNLYTSLKGKAISVISTKCLCIFSVDSSIYLNPETGRNFAPEKKYMRLGRLVPPSPQCGFFPHSSCGFFFPLELT